MRARGRRNRTDGARSARARGKRVASKKKKKTPKSATAPFPRNNRSIRVGS